MHGEPDAVHDEPDAVHDGTVFWQVFHKWGWVIFEKCVETLLDIRSHGLPLSSFCPSSGFPEFLKSKIKRLVTWICRQIYLQDDPDLSLSFDIEMPVFCCLATLKCLSFHAGISPTFNLSPT